MKQNETTGELGCYRISPMYFQMQSRVYSGSQVVRLGVLGGCIMKCTKAIESFPWAITV